MDLSAIINNEAGDDKVAAVVAQQPPTPSSSSAHPQSRHASSANANKLYSEYSTNVGRQSQHDNGRNSGSYEYEQSKQQSRNTSVSAEYHSQSRTPHQQFASPTATYQRPPLQSAPVPLAHSNNELLSRSPRSTASYPSQSPLFPRTSSGPFSYQPTNSPGQERNSIPHQTSGGSTIQRQESYPQPSISQYLTSPVPLTPPSAIGSSGGYPPFLQQQQHSRSLSAHSNSTPTSAHSQYNQSPLLASAYPAPAHSQQRSQPGTPLGPPISIHRSGTYSQQQQQYSSEARLSTSPYQSRQSLPSPLPPATLPYNQQEYERKISNEAEQRGIYAYDGQGDPRAQSQSQQILQAHVPTSLPPQQAQYERRRPREQSLSLSPKTTLVTPVPQQTQSREPAYVPQSQPQPQSQTQKEHHAMSRDKEEPRDRADGGPKRILDRQSSERSDGRGSEPPMQRRRIDETPDTEGETTTDERSPEQQRQRQIKRETQSQTPQPPAQYKRPRSKDSQRDGEMQRPRKRKRYTQETMPIWARSWPEFIRFKKMHPGGTFYGVPVGDIGGPIPERSSAQPQVNGTESQQAALQQPVHTNGALIAPLTDDISALLGLPFAPNISGIPPPTPVTKQIADFLYLTVISRNDWNQLQANKIQIEIEAKLGTLIDKSTNRRLELPIASECVLAAGFGGTQGKVAFRSEMQEDVFKNGNGYLNEMTKQSITSGVPIAYSHRREVDTFHHLPPAALNELPPAMQNILNTPSNRNRGLKVRVSHDQKTGKEIARIVKARVADLDVYFPQSLLDCRISVNLEMEFNGELPIDAGVRKAANDDEGERRKDRLSYKQSGYTIDLTQVSSGTAPPTHELEIEIDTDVLVQQGRRLATGEGHAYVEFVEGLVARMRSLIGELGE